MLTQFDTNVFGLVREIQMVLPGMRERRAGAIVNVSSAGVYITPPFSGCYVGSKAAAGALSEALCQELRPFGVRVILIEPGGFATRFGVNTQRARRTTEVIPYHPALQRFVAMIRERAATAPAARDPRQVADAIYAAVVTDSPQFRYVIPSRAGGVRAGLDAIAFRLEALFRSGPYVTLADTFGALFDSRAAHGTPDQPPSSESPAGAPAMPAAALPG